MNIENIKTSYVDSLDNPSLKNGVLEFKEYFEGTDKVSRIIKTVKNSYEIIKEFYYSGKVSREDCLIHNNQGKLIFRATNFYSQDEEFKQGYYMSCDYKEDNSRVYKLKISNIRNKSDLSIQWSEVGEDRRMLDLLINTE